MPRWAWHDTYSASRRRYFELLPKGPAARLRPSTSVAELRVVVAIDAGSAEFTDKPISSRYLTQDETLWLRTKRDRMSLKRIDYRGTTVIEQRMPGARLIRESAVMREQSRDSARAT